MDNEGATIDPSQVVTDRGRSCLHLKIRQPNDPEGAYLCGLVRSLTSFTYGTVTVRARVPSGRGVWPAIWLLTQSNVWPPEMDMLEVLGADPTTGYCTHHFVDPATGRRERLQGKITGVDLSAAFHTYQLRWEPGKTVYLFDGRPVLTIEDSPAEPMYLILSIAVGKASSWGGPPESGLLLDASFDIDWVSVTQP